MILIIDNYDSFTYNLYQYLGELDRVVAVRNDKITVQGIEKLNPDFIVISPGPGRPENAGISKTVINYFKDKIPILGVCLGHQCIASVFGGNIIENDMLYHGKQSEIHIDKDNNNGIFKEISSPFKATRYHSLIMDKSNIPDKLEVTAWTEDKEIMAIKHKDYPVVGVQFHPESILTNVGKKILANFISK